MAEGRLRAARVLEAVKGLGFTHIVWLPDSETGLMHRALQGERSVTLVPVCREGEAVAIAAGLWVGGKRPLVMMQSTGFFEAGDSIRGLALDVRLPLVLLVGYRGYRGDGPSSDSAAVHLEPLLRAWSIPYYLLERDSEVERIAMAHRDAEATARPVAILICREYQ
ncbi:MAG: hypothetical protein HYU29_09385 [Chloroflexi bacterium]|nr:hypothetical protein [Chloroflexota bacterium]